ncbi:squalene/phytoene synthase [Roseinatronobacter thiooxidans]|uniref:Squalene/phytoene synthase n=1 Tax=Roseinatronobacter thiooxidans TaxID=121821 RepID=A0A2W7R1B2_9RHOB|nr:squalene/phytoene synthase family protein [Roseinatronobacter thiooxidans]PZX47899.1 squalene/phytoene synthase [Roseinatronobacter thiooxidans]
MTALAEKLRLGDPDRHAATLAAPEEERAKLWPLYGFNLEIARAPWMTTEPMISEMRLQFWADVLDEIDSGTAPRAHEVASPLADLWRACNLPLALGHEMVAARRWDIYREPFADEAAFEQHLQATNGNLMWLAAMSLGADQRAEGPVRDMGYAAGLANWLLAVPRLEAAGRIPLVDGRDSAVAALAQSGLLRLKRARANRGYVPANLLPVMLTGWQAGAILKTAARSPHLVQAGQLQASEFTRRGSLFLRALTGRW